MDLYSTFVKRFMFECLVAFPSWEFIISSLVIILGFGGVATMIRFHVMISHCLLDPEGIQVRETLDEVHIPLAHTLVHNHGCR